MSNQHKALVPVAGVESLIHLLRGQKVMLDADLARLYGVTTGNLNKAVSRNPERFPPDFVFQVSPEEAVGLTFQSGISNQRGGRRHRPYAFTQEGIAMLSGVLRSVRAARVNVEIMRAYVRLHGFLATQDALARRLAELETKFTSHDKSIQQIFAAIKQAFAEGAAPPARREIGFHVHLKPSKAAGEEPKVSAASNSKRKASSP